MAKTNKAKEYEDQLEKIISDADENITALTASLETIVNQAQSDAVKIKEYAKSILSDESEERTLEDDIRDAKDNIDKLLESAKQASKNLGVKYRSFMAAYDQVLGNTGEQPVYIVDDASAPDDAEIQTDKAGNKFYLRPHVPKGIKNELEQLLDSSKKDIAKIKDEIEHHLMGATNVGLAVAYEEARKEHKEKVERQEHLFGLSIIMLLLSPVISLTLTRYFPISMPEAADFWTLVSRRLFLVIPMSLPLVWFAIHVAHQARDHRRLWEEYRHKWAVARSYLGIRTQLEELNIDDENEELLKDLIRNTISMQSVNPSVTLSEEYKSDFPIYHLIDRLGIKRLLRSLNLKESEMPGILEKIYGVIAAETTASKNLRHESTATSSAKIEGDNES